MSWPLWAGNSPGGLAWWAFVAWLAAVAWSDFRSRRIGNVLIATGAAMALLLVLMQVGDGSGSDVLKSIGMAFLLVAALFLPAWWLGYMGAADVKLALALALWGGYHALTLMWVMASVLAMVHSVVLLARRRRMRAAAANAEAPPALPVAGPQRLVPYGAYLAIGGVVLALAALGGR
jgi:prepilin peptidase CpaA